MMNTDNLSGSATNQIEEVRALICGFLLSYIDFIIIIIIIVFKINKKARIPFHYYWLIMTLPQYI